VFGAPHGQCRELYNHTGTNHPTTAAGGTGHKEPTMSFNITVRTFTANVTANTFNGVAEVPVQNVPGFLLDTGDGLRSPASATVRFGYWSFPYGGNMIAKIKGNQPNSVPKSGEASPVEVLIDGSWRPAQAVIPVGMRSSMSTAVAALWQAALAGGATEVKDATGVKRTFGNNTGNAAATQAANAAAAEAAAKAAKELEDLKSMVAALAAQNAALMAKLDAPAPTAEAKAPAAKAK